MKTIEIEGYLKQAKLEEVIHEIVGDANWVGREQRLPEGRCRWDMVYMQDGEQVAVEFDADSHYRDSLRIRADRAKDAIGKAHGQRVIRFPYWVQLTTETLQHFFGFQANIVQDFPHGFVATKLFPASFCELGVSKFIDEFLTLPEGVQTQIRETLKQRSQEWGAEYVVPSCLLYLLED